MNNCYVTLKYSKIRDIKGKKLLFINALSLHALSSAKAYNRFGQNDNKEIESYLNK